MARKISDEMKVDKRYSFRKNSDYDPKLGREDKVGEPILRKWIINNEDQGILEEELRIPPVEGRKVRRVNK